MTLGDKISKLRKENNYTQEQLADILGVSRQAISKWESDLTYPETEKLIRISELFCCSLDYLIKDKEDKEETENGIRKYLHERKSKKTVWGMPLWHVAKNARGFLAVGLNAKGVIAVGSVYERLGSLTTENRAAVKEALDTVVPTYLAWAKELIKAFL